MNKISFLLMLVAATGLAQIRGNGIIETKSFVIAGTRNIKIEFVANITIDASETENLTITTDSNLFDLIEKKVVGETLILKQKEWVEPSKMAIISIGCPNLFRVQQGTHGITRIINVDNDELRVNAPIGNIFIEGKTENLRLGAEISSIDATKITAKNVYVNLWSTGIIKVDVTDLLWADVSNGGNLIYVSKPNKLNVNTKGSEKVISFNKVEEAKRSDIEYISFKIRNNSNDRNHFEVVGPKPDGTKFGYSFPMMPNAIRVETWTIGTKIYQLNGLGLKELIMIIEKANEHTTIELF